MDGEQYGARRDFDTFDIASVWPTSAHVAPFPIHKLASPTSTAPSQPPTPRAEVPAMSEYDCGSMLP